MTHEHYILVGEPVTHRVEKDLNRTLQRVYKLISDIRQRLGQEALITLTVAVHIPVKSTT